MINLDCMTLGEIEAAARNLSLLAKYARLKRSAMLARERGDIIFAGDTEATCDDLYRQLDTSFKW